jgi:hypothetical protein
MMIQSEKTDQKPVMEKLGEFFSTKTLGLDFCD